MNIVTFEDLQKLSGRKQKTAVARWCKKVGIKYHRDADGYPVTTSEALDRSLAKSVESGPDWSRASAKKKAAPQSSRETRPVVLRASEQMAPVVQGTGRTTGVAPLFISSGRDLDWLTR